MVDPVTAGLIGWACGKLADRVLKRLASNTELTREVDKVIADWADSLPANRYVNPKALFPEVNLETAKKERPEYYALQASLVQKKPPSKEMWHAVFMESWQWVRDNIEERQAFFNLDEPQASKELERLAEMTHGVCIHFKPIFETAVIEGIYVIDGKVEVIDHKLNVFRTYLEEILEVIKQKQGSIVDAEDEYKRVLMEELGTIRMLGLPGFSSVPVDLLDTFVSLDITAMSAGEGRQKIEPHEMSGEADRKLSPESTLKRAFKDHRMLLILGDPGSGKTTLVKYYAVLCLKGERHQELGYTEPPFVIYLPLREIESKDGEFCPLNECLAKWASRHYISISAESFLGWLRNRETLILLDGLDEISDLDKRRKICDWIDDAAVGLKKARFIVTSRWTGYRKVDGIELGFEHLRADVRDFSPEQQKEFLEKWFVAAYQREPHDEKVPEPQWRERQTQKGLGRAKAIVDFLAEEENKGVLELAGVPMLLHVIAILWREQENLPQGRAELYQAALKYILDYRDRRRNIKPVLKATQALRVLCPVSFWMQDELHYDEVQKDKMHQQMQPILDTIDDTVRSGRFCENLQDRAGLITDYGDDAYIFRHKSFREYLAGLELVTLAGRDKECLWRIAGQFGEDWWNEPLRFFMGEVDDILFDQFMDALFNSDASKELDQKSYDLLLTMVGEAPQKRIDSLKRRLNESDSTEKQRRYIIDCLKTIGSKSALEAIKEFGEKQAETEAGSFALEITYEEQIGFIPKIVSKTLADVLDKIPKAFRNQFELNAEYIPIYGGSFTYSVTKKFESVSTVYFARYPVTNKRYRRFIRYLAGQEKDLSEILAVKLFQERMLESAKTIDGFLKYLGSDLGTWAEKLRSEYDDEKRFKGDDQPVVGVSWFSARAYCCWLSLLEAASKGAPIEASVNKYRLPTELEWEWAASGGDREYPWGNTEPNDKLANYGENVGATTPVGRYPDGVTPEGLMDMAGNVWEWMENRYSKTGEARSLRGGSWDRYEVYLRCSRRIGYRPEDRDGVVGFRVVVSQS
ncbi:MAG: SUMF1/EgtB/PvdO family nonheme iron enzyme [Sedimentisphaerales bacterium]|nr:SUMF1/EgtB/PvdO family nonheme iron enzyme [Sedimentisphaerales bacterium]